jgi:hypothetical protein
MELALTNVEFRLQACERCHRPILHVLREPAAARGTGEFGICSSCEPATFERAALEAGRHEFLR